MSPIKPVSKNPVIDNTQNNQNQVFSLNDVKEVLGNTKNPKDFKPVGAPGRARNDLRKSLDVKMFAPLVVKYII